MSELKIWRDEPGLLFDHKNLVALIIPLLIEQLLAILVGMADTIMIAHVGEYAVSGVSLVDGVMILFIQMFGALATGGGVIAGQYLGFKEPKLACKASDQMVWFIVGFSTVIMIFLYIGKKFILNVVFGAISPEVYSAADTYLKITVASIPFLALYNSCAAIFRMQGNSKVSMKVSMLMNIINVTGNALCIYVLGWGTAGVALPTLVSRMVAAIVITVLALNQDLTLHLQRTLHFIPDWKMIKRILRIGIPGGMESCLFQLGKILILSLVTTFGTFAIAANAVGNSVAVFQTLPGQAIGLAMTTVVARCVGANDYVQARYYTRKLIALIYVSFFAVNGLIFLVLPGILHLYNLSDEAFSAAKTIITIHGACGCVLWPLAFSFPNTLRAAGDAKYTMTVSLCTMVTCRIVLSYVLGKYMGFVIVGVWSEMIIDWVFRVIFFVIRYRGNKWTLIKSI